MFDEDDEEEINSEKIVDIRESFYANLSEETPDLDESPLPFYLQNIFATNKTGLCVDHADKERGSWDTQFEFLLSCIGYVVGLGNVWRFPAKVYEGGGGAFLIPYITFSILFGGPMMVIEMSLGQFRGFSCSRAFEMCPILSGVGWTIVITSFIVMINYTIIIARCFFYLASSFHLTLPWSVCTNPFNTPKCINTLINTNLTNVSPKDTSGSEFWYLYVTGERRPDGTFITITDPFGSPNIYCILSLATILIISCLTTMFGVQITGKIIYITVVFPIVAILQFIILACTLPGAVKGIKYYLYPDLSKLMESNTYIMALEQLLFSTGIATGGMITISSFNRFRDKVYRNVIIVMCIDFFTSLISGFATFPILGYMSYRSGKEIPDLISSSSHLFFITYPEALATLTNSNVWCGLFMFMSVTLGIDSLFVLLETSTMAVFDSSTVFNTKKHKTIITVIVCIVVFIFATIFITPGGLNWLHIFDVKTSSFILTLSLISEVIVICYVYGIRRFKNDMELMTGSTLGPFWLFNICVIVPAGAIIILSMVIINDGKIIRYNIEFPEWASKGGWICNIVILSPIYLGAIFVLVDYRIRNPSLSCLNWLKLCVKPPITWGPKSKRYWVQSALYAKKLLKYKDNPSFIKSLTKEDHIEKLIHLAEKQLQKTTSE